MNKVLRSVERAVRRSVKVLKRRVRSTQRVPRCLSMEVRSEYEVRQAADRMAEPARIERAAMESPIRELVALNTPALFLNIVQRGGAVRVVMKPWDGRSTRFRGRNYFVDIGSEAPEGIEAFTYAPFSHVTTLFPTAPDHPLYVVSIEHQGMFEYHGEFPPYLTHLTIMVNGVVTARCERLLHERGTQVYLFGRVA